MQNASETFESQNRYSLRGRGDDCRTVCYGMAHCSHVKGDEKMSDLIRFFTPRGWAVICLAVAIVITAYTIA